KYNFAPAVALFYNPATVKPWTETDCLLVGQRLVFELSYDADSDIFRSQLEAAAKMTFDDSSMPNLVARKGIGDDFDILAPFDPTYTLPSGWTGMNGSKTRASLDGADPAAMLALYAAD